MGKIDDITKSEIDEWLSKLIIMTAEVNYRTDFKTGEIIFKDKVALIRQIKNTVQEFAKQRNIDMATVNAYLESIYYRKFKEETTKPYKREYKELLNLLYDIEMETAER